MAITFWRNVQRKITTQEMDASFDTLVADIANAGLSAEMPDGQIYIGDNTNTASLETLDTSIVPETTDKRYQSDLQDTYNDATSSIQGQIDNKAPIASPTFTGTVTTPDVVVSNATVSTPTFFDSAKKLITTTAQLWGTWVQTWGSKATPVDADTIGFYNSASTFVGVKSTLLNLWNNYIKVKLAADNYFAFNGRSWSNMRVTTNTHPYVKWWDGINDLGGGVQRGNGTIGYSTGQLYMVTIFSANNSPYCSLQAIITVSSSDNVSNIFFIKESSNTSILNLTISANKALITNPSAQGYSIFVEKLTEGYGLLTAHYYKNEAYSSDGQTKYWTGSAGFGVGHSSQNASAIGQFDSTTKGFLGPRMTTAQKNAITKVEGLTVYDTDLDSLCQTNGTVWSSIGSSSLVFISSKGEFPAPSGGIITLLANTTYFINGTIDLTGDRLVCGANTTIIGGSSENCRLKSTGNPGALITSVYSLPLRNITLEADLAVNLDGDGTTTALDWFGVNFTDCAVIGTVKDYTNFIMSDCAFLNSGGMTLDGTFGSVGFSQSLFDCNTANTAISLTSTCTITRRFRIIYSSFVVGSGETGINIDPSATIPTESYILVTVNFSGGGTYITGVTHTSNDSLFSNCTGITNTAVNGQLYMQANATATTVSATNTFYKIAGTTTPSADNSKFTHSNNRLTCDAVISRKYLLHCDLSFSSTATNVCEFGFYDSQLSAVRTPSKTKSTANSAGRAENISFGCVVTMVAGDYIEIHTANTSAVNDITVDQLNFIITEIR